MAANPFTGEEEDGGRRVSVRLPNGKEVLGYVLSSYLVTVHFADGQEVNVHDIIQIDSIPRQVTARDFNLEMESNTRGVPWPGLVGKPSTVTLWHREPASQ